MDFVGNSISGSCKGLGRQKLIFIFILITFYLLGIPIVYFLGFYYDMKIKGVWLGFTINVYLLNLGYWIVLFYKSIKSTIQQRKHELKGF